MNRTAVIVIGVVLAVAVGVVVIWLLATSSAPQPTTTQPTTTTPDTTTQQEDSTSDEVPLDPNAATPSDSLTASVEIRDSAFTPARLTVKKGTTVTWTNRDSMGHNVVSDDNAPEGGPPKTAELLGQGEVFSFTYDTVGIFPYHCTPHPFMQGTIEVVE